MGINSNGIFCVRTYILPPAQRIQRKLYIALRCDDNPTQVHIILKNGKTPANNFIAGHMNAGGIL